MVQRYVANPLLLDGGGRKFDMRCWVLLDSEYNIHLYRQVLNLLVLTLTLTLTSV